MLIEDRTEHGILRCSDELAAYFDRVYVLTTDTPVGHQRMENFKQHLTGFSFGDIHIRTSVTVNNTVPARWKRRSWAQCLSVISILTEAVSMGYKKILILENDYECPAVFSPIIVQEMDVIPADWDIACFHSWGHLASQAITGNDYSVPANQNRVEGQHWYPGHVVIGQQCCAYNLDTAALAELNAKFPFLQGSMMGVLSPLFRIINQLANPQNWIVGYANRGTGEVGMVMDRTITNRTSVLSPVTYVNHLSIFGRHMPGISTIADEEEANDAV